MYSQTLDVFHLILPSDSFRVGMYLFYVYLDKFANYKISSDKNEGGKIIPSNLLDVESVDYNRASDVLLLFMSFLKR